MMSMDREWESSTKKIIRFSLGVSGPGETKKLTLQGIVNYEFKKGIVLITDYPLKSENVLDLNEKLNGYQVGVVRRVVACGKAYMAHIDLK
jgi:hypothetical protein